MSILQNTIIIYSTPICPYCTLAKNLLTRKGLMFTEVDVSDPQERLALMEKAGGRKTVPQIFINDHHIGGYDDLTSADQSGELDNLLRK
ncbi:MAG: glutaredoxin 3 [Candidatus Paracaedimonas acanthamoebae]|uniref:Glutaredoxin n=1 Tax=Candidatus Paracaedimonas acanthamoebae TaxID=244581 RepID=A0A8J7PK37_9PROT|nr:glutaredoxin 3 [Candidatus Paracaedimonas acanthamoebae]